MSPGLAPGNPAAPNGAAANVATTPNASTAAGRAASGAAAGGGTVGTMGTMGTMGTTPGTGVAAGQSGAGDATSTLGAAGASVVAGTGAPASGTGVVAQAGSGSTPAGGASQWTMIGYDASGSYNNIAETVLTKDNAASLTMAWQVDMGTNVYGAPLQIGDKVYASSSAGVKALDAATGNVLWQNANSTTGSLAFDSGMLYLYTATGNIVALDAATGMMKWSQAPMGNPGGDGSSSPVVAGNAVLIGGSNGGSEILGARFRGFLAALDKTTGQGLWTTFTVPETAAGASLWSSAAADVAAGMAFGTTGNNHGDPATDSSDSFIGFDLKTGAIKWKNQRTMNDTWNGTAGTTDSAPPDADFGANPVTYEAMVNGVLTKLVSSGQKIGAAHAVKRDDGMLVWTRQLCTGMNTRDGKMGIFVNGAWSGKNMLFACNNAGTSQLFGLDGGTGDIAWMTPLSGEVYGRISVANGVGFVGAGANLVVFDTDTGKIVKMVPSAGGTVAGTITIANGRVAYGEGLTWADGVAGRTLWMLKVQ